MKDYDTDLQYESERERDADAKCRGCGELFTIGELSATGFCQGCVAEDKENDG